MPTLSRDEDETGSQPRAHLWWNDWTTPQRTWLIPEAALYVAVALSCGMDPRKVDPLRERGLTNELRRRLSIALANLGKRDGIRIVGASHSVVSQRDVFSKVRMREFSSWVAATGWDLPDEFPRPPGAEEARDVQKWPWGSYSTELLGHLAAAAQHHWLSYIPGKPSTAPKSRTVEDWLVKERKVSGKVAKAMAQILRADDMRQGPHVDR